jgi:hypothetical protein
MSLSPNSHPSCSVANPHHFVNFDADPDPACHFEADPDSTVHFDAEPDLALSFEIKAQNLGKCSSKLIFLTFWLAI